MSAYVPSSEYHVGSTRLGSRSRRNSAPNAPTVRAVGNRAAETPGGEGEGLPTAGRLTAYVLRVVSSTCAAHCERNGGWLAGAALWRSGRRSAGMGIGRSALTLAPPVFPTG